METECVAEVVYDLNESIPKAVSETLPASALRDLALRRRNLRDLNAIQDIVYMEEDQVLSADEALARVLDHYRRFVPFERPRMEVPELSFFVVPRLPHA